MSQGNQEIHWSSKKMKILNIIWHIYHLQWVISDFQFKDFSKNSERKNQFFRNSLNSKDTLHWIIMPERWESIKQMTHTVNTSFLNTKKSCLSVSKKIILTPKWLYKLDGVSNLVLKQPDEYTYYMHLQLMNETYGYIHLHGSYITIFTISKKF